MLKHSDTPPVPPTPIGYTPLKYLESNGHQYFDIQMALCTLPTIVPTATIDVQLTQIGLLQAIFGVAAPQNGSRFILGAESPTATTTNIFACIDNTSYLAPQYPNDLFRHTVKMTVVSGANNKWAPQLSIDDGVPSVGYYSTVPPALNWAKSALFACSFYQRWASTIQPNLYAYMKCFSASFYAGADLTRDFIPVMRNSDGVVGMWDRVSETLFVNEGTGSFGYETYDGVYVAPV